jgi:hypothetical protein
MPPLCRRHDSIVIGEIRVNIHHPAAAVKIHRRRRMGSRGAAEDAARADYTRSAAEPERPLPEAVAVTVKVAKRTP